MSLTTYDPESVAVQVGGVLATGFAEDTLIEITHEEPRVSLKIGADGEAVRSMSKNRAAEIKLTFLHSSPMVAVLDGFRIADDANGVGVVPFSVFDPSTGTLMATDGCWVMSPPDRSFGKEAQNVEITLKTHDLREAHNGGTLL